MKIRAKDLKPVKNFFVYYHGKHSGDYNFPEIAIYDNFSSCSICIKWQVTKGKDKPYGMTIETVGSYPKTSIKLISRIGRIIDLDWENKPKNILKALHKLKINRRVYCGGKAYWVPNRYKNATESYEDAFIAKRVNAQKRG